MYNVPYFKTDNNQELTDFMQAHPFIMLIANGTPYPVATQIPVLIEEREGKMFLRGHIMRKTDHHLALEKDPNVLIVFSGAHAYVSASWYTNQQVGSTWNYGAVHVKGTLQFMDEAGLLDLLTRLTEKFENNPQSPSLVPRLPKDYVQSMMKGIAGIEIEVKHVEHVFKLSQNRDEQSFQNIIYQLDKGDTNEKAVATWMKSRGKIKK